MNSTEFNYLLHLQDIYTEILGHKWKSREAKEEIHEKLNSITERLLKIEEQQIHIGQE